VRAVFADTVYWIAVANPDDPWAESARRSREALGAARLVTTDEVLTEFLAALSKGGSHLRRVAVESVQAILRNPNVKVIPQTRESFLKALDRYAERPDKEYSLTDCSSMNVLDAENIREVLTADHHFAQEGYSVLMQK